MPGPPGPHVPREALAAHYLGVPSVCEQAKRPYAHFSCVPYVRPVTVVSVSLLMP